MTIRVYKLTDQNNKTYNDTLWGENVSHETDGSGELCSAGWLHAYTSPLLAVFFNLIHADIKNPKLWEAYGNGQRMDDAGLKIGFTKLMTKKEIPLPVVTNTQYIAFGILCALEVYKEPGFVQWAKNWLNGTDRSEESARLAAFYTTCPNSAYYAAYSHVDDFRGTFAVYAAVNATTSAHQKINLKLLAQKAMKY